tara:strand:- start:643 stop:780 length:138 start_codon:yes stop_codon:yes gene_type:complete
LKDGKRAVTGNHFQTNVFTMASADHILEFTTAKLTCDWGLLRLFG